VLNITPDGKVSTLIRSEGSWYPAGVAFKNGDLYILESEKATNRPRVRKLSSDGKVSVLATIGENSSPPVSETRHNQNTEPTLAPKRITVFALLGAGALALTFLIWRARRKTIARPQPND
jgi:hypothetical protein